MHKNYSAENGSWPVTGFRSREPLKDLKDSKQILNESKLFPWSSRISLVPFRTFRGPLFPKPVTGQELFFAVSYSKLGLGQKSLMRLSILWLLKYITDKSVIFYTKFLNSIIFWKFFYEKKLTLARIWTPDLDQHGTIQVNSGKICRHILV